MPTALTTINIAKEQEATYQPILLADFLFCDGSALHLCTHPLNAAEGGFSVPAIALGGSLGTFAGGNYSARLAEQNIGAIQALSQQGISLIPQVSLTIEDPDALIYLANEYTIGFRGAVLTLTLVLWDAGANTFSTDARYIYAGICEKAYNNGAQTIVPSVSEIGKKVLPTVLLQRTCPWLNPTTVAQRASADNPDSAYYRCGETRDLVTAPPCQYTTATCTRLTRRGNITWDPINQQFAKSYLDGKNSLIINTLSGGVIGRPIPLLYGTGWIKADPIATVGDGNYTRFETAAALGPLAGILQFVVAGESLSPSNNPDGSVNSYANKDFRYAWVNSGKRDGAPNADAPWNGNGDPYGNITAFEAVVPKDVAAANSAQSCQILAQGGSARIYMQIASIGVTANVATVNLTGLNKTFITAAGQTVTFTITGSPVPGMNGTWTKNFPNFSNSMFQFACPGVANGSGAGGMVYANAYTESPVWIYWDLRVKGGDDYSQINLALACAAAEVCSPQILIQGSTAIAWLAKNPGDTTISVLSADGFPASGQVQIDSEVISYSGTDVHFDGTHYIPRLTGCAHVAGVSATHAIGATVKDTVSTVNRARYSTNLVITERRSVADILRGIQAACNMIVNRNTNTGQYETYIEDTLPDSQPAPISGSNYNTPVPGFDKTGNATTGYAAYRFDELTDILADSRKKTTLEEQQRGINDFPNRLQFNFADVSQTYAQSSISVDDIDDVYRIGQEIPGSPITMPEGITSYDQALCQARLILAKSLHGNEAGDGRGTRLFKFKTTFKAVHLRVGHIVLLNSARLGITNQTFRVMAIQPTTNWEEATITIAWHSDAWYALGYGRKLPQDSGNRRMTQASKTPLQWTANQDAASSDAVLPTGYKTFGLASVYSTNADGSQSVRISATGEQLVNQFSGVAQSPIVSLVPTVAASGGSIVGGQSYYLAVAAKDGSGLLSPLSEVVRVDVASGSANTIMLPVTTWPGTVSGYVLYAGRTAQRLTAQAEASGTPTSITITSFTPYGESAPDGSFDHLEADASLCLLNGVAVGQATANASSSTVTFNGTPFTGLTLTGRIASVVASDADTRVRNFLITGNTASTLTFGSTPDILADDWVCVRSLVTVAGQTVTDSLWTLTPSALVGKVLRTIAGSGTPQYQTITANTATSITVAAAWTYPIDSTSIVIVEEPAVLTTIRTSRLSTNVRHTSTSIGIDCKNYAGRFVRVTCYAADGRNTRAAEALALTRDLYIAGAAGAISIAGAPAAITSFGMDYEIEGTLAQGGGVWHWTGSVWSRTGNSSHSIGDAHAGSQSVQCKFTVGVPTDVNTAGVWVVHSVYPDATYTTPIPSTESGWFGNGWGIVTNNQPPQGAPFTVYGSWNVLGSFAAYGGYDYEEFTAWTYNRNPNPGYNAPGSASPLIIKVAWPAGYLPSSTAIALPTYFNASQTTSTINGIDNVRFKFQSIIPAEPTGARLCIMHGLYDSTFTTINITTGSGWGPDGWGLAKDETPTKSVVGTCTATGTAVVGLTGDPYTAALVGKEIIFDRGTSNVVRIVAAVTDATHLTLTASVGATLTNKAFESLWTSTTGDIPIPATTTYQRWTPWMVGPDGTILKPAAGTLKTDLTTAATAGINSSALTVGSNALLNSILNLQVVPVTTLTGSGTVALAGNTTFQGPGGASVLIASGYVTCTDSSGAIFQVSGGGAVMKDSTGQNILRADGSGVMVQYGGSTGPGTAVLAGGVTIAGQWSGITPVGPKVSISSSLLDVNFGSSGARLYLDSGGGYFLGATSGGFCSVYPTSASIAYSLCSLQASTTGIYINAQNKGVTIYAGGGDLNLQSGSYDINLAGSSYSVTNPSSFRSAISAAGYRTSGDYGSGSPSSLNYLRGDGTWSAISGYAVSGSNGDITLLSACATLGAATVTISNPPKFNGPQPAGASGVGTLNNLPYGKSGNPSCFIEVYDNTGTLRFIPAW